MNPDFHLTEELSPREMQLEEENLRLKETISSNFKLFEAILSNGRDGVTLTGPDRRIVRVLRGLTGIDPNSFSGHLVDLLAVPEDREMVVDAYRQLLNGGVGKVEIVVRFPDGDGAPCTYAATLTDMLDNPNVRGIVWNYSESF